MEFFGTLTGLIYVLLVIRQNPLCWPVGIINAAFYLWVFFTAKLYADSTLQGIYIILCAYGWWLWIRGDSGESKISISKLPKQQIVSCSVILVFGSAILGYFFRSHTDADLPYLDSFATITSLVAQWMTSKKYLENWKLWIGVNTLYVGMYIYKHLYMTAGLYFLFFILAIQGYRVWSKEYAAKTP